MILKIFNAFFFKAPTIKAKNGSESIYLPIITKKIIAKIELKIVKILKKFENVSDLALAISHKKQYIIKKTIIPIKIRFIINDYNT